MSATLAPARSFVLDALERRDPARHQVGDVAGPEELLAADEDVLVVLVPAEAGTGAEGLGDLRLGLQRTQGEHESARQVRRSVGVRQQEGLLLGQRVDVLAVGARDVAAGRLAAQPLRDVPRVGAGPGRELGGRRRTLGQRLEEAEPVARHHASGRDGGAEVAGELSDEFVDLVHVECHHEPPGRGTGRSGHLRPPSSGRLQPRCNSAAMASARLRAAGGPGKGELCERSTRMWRATSSATGSRSATRSTAPAR